MPWVLPLKLNKKVESAKSLATKYIFKVGKIQIHYLRHKYQQFLCSNIAMTIFNIF